MKLDIDYVSDLHLGFYASKLDKIELIDKLVEEKIKPQVNSNILVIAGDIDEDIDRVCEFLYACSKYYSKVIFILGNHEYYIPNIKFIFATNYLNKLPIAFQTRVKLVELQNYTEDELKQIINNKYPELNKDGLESIVKACKGTPRTALRLAGDVISGLKTEKIEKASADDINNILNSRFGIDPTTGLSESEFTIIQKVCERGHLSTTAIANTLKLSIKDARDRYINPLQVSDWLCITPRGVVPGFKTYENYRLFIKKIK